MKHKKLDEAGPFTIACIASWAAYLLQTGCFIDFKRDGKEADGGLDAAWDSSLPDGDLDGHQPNICGDETAREGEICDGTDLGGETCESQGLCGGDLGCTADCSALDPAGCTGMVFGNGQDGDVVVSGTVNLNMHPIAEGRSCSDGGDAVSYNVDALGDDFADLSSLVSPGCLAPGDEVLLLNLQTHSRNLVERAGVWEIMTVSLVDDTRVYFTTSKINCYGDDPCDQNMGPAKTEHRVVLQRIPQYQSMTVNVSTVLSANAFDFEKGGVLFFKVRGELQVDGVIDLSAVGYQGGEGGRNDNGRQGDSLGDDVRSSQINNLGGGGAGQTDTAETSGGGGGANGEEGGRGQGTIGSGYGGAPYSTANLEEKLFLGSGGGVVEAATTAASGVMVDQEAGSSPSMR